MERWISHEGCPWSGIHTLNFFFFFFFFEGNKQEETKNEKPKVGEINMEFVFKFLSLTVRLQLQDSQILGEDLLGKPNTEHRWP